MKNEINRIYVGIPEEIRDRIIWDEDPFRTNPLSLEEGGGDVVIEHKNGKVLGYDKIKDAGAYIDKIFVDELFKHINDEDSKVIEEELEEPIVIESRYSKEAEVFSRKYIKQVFARQYKMKDYETVSFEKIWDSETSIDDPWTAVCKYFDDPNYLRVEI